MSRIGQKEIKIPDKVKVLFKDKEIKVSGPKGELSQIVRDGIDVTIKDDTAFVKRKGDSKKLKALHGLYRSLLNNMISGVSEGFTRKLEFNGVGYRAKLNGNVLDIQIGFSHPVNFELPKGISCEVKDNVFVTLSGIDKQLVGQTAANIRMIRPPEPYKQKGIKYAEEIVKKKAGKSAK